MTTTMREKAIKAAVEALEDANLSDLSSQAIAMTDGMVSVDGVIDMGAVLDAILDTLREPDEGMVLAGSAADPAFVGDMFTAMIDHVRKS